MADLTELRAARDRVLLYVYEHGAGDVEWGVRDDEIRAALAMSDDLFDRVINVLERQGCLEPGEVGRTCLSRIGQERARELGPPVAMSPAPPPGHRVINIATGHGAVVQVAGDHARLSATFDARKIEFYQIVAELERAADRLPEAEKARNMGLIQLLKQEAGKAIVSAATKALALSLDDALGLARQRLLELLGIPQG